MYQLEFQISSLRVIRFYLVPIQTTTLHSFITVKLGFFLSHTSFDFHSLNTTFTVVLFQLDITKVCFTDNHGYIFIALYKLTFNYVID